MFLSAVMERNAPLVDAAVELHRAGAVPPGTFVLDVDTVERNAALIAQAAAGAGIRLFFMTKQIGRNPVASRRVLEHIPAAVAVDMDDADALAAAGIPVGHAGHLVQPPEAAIARLLRYRPQVVTVYSVAKAEQIAAEARREGLEQPLLLRVTGDGDETFPGQEGGIPVEDVVSARDAIDALDGVRVAGVTSYPNIAFDGERFRPTGNLTTLARAVEALGSVEQVNAAGHTSVDVLPIVAAAGATHAEPGHALTGTTPLAATGVTPERPAVCFVSEVSHVDDHHISVFGGGFYERGHAATGLLVHGDRRTRHDLLPLAPGSIDYYRRLRRDGSPVCVGDTVVFAFRFQAFVSRARVAAVEGLASGHVQLAGLHDVYGRPVSAAAGSVEEAPA